MARTASKGGFYIQNTTSNIVHVVTTDKKIDDNLRPKEELHDTLWIPIECENDPNIHKLLARNTVAKVTEGEVLERGEIEAEQAKTADAEALALASIDQSEKKALIEVDCDAKTKAGVACKNKAYVTKEHREAGKPCYCSIHEDGFKNELETQVV